MDFHPYETYLFQKYRPMSTNEALEEVFFDDIFLDG
jgi:hypothetical protein